MQSLSDYIASFEEVAPIDPPHLSARAARRAAALAAPRRPVVFMEGWSLRLAPAYDEELWAEAGAPVDVMARLGGESVRLRVTWPLIERLLREFEPRVEPARLGAEIAAMALEAALREPIEALESALGREAALLRLARPQTDPQCARLDLAMHSDDTPAPYPAAVFGPSTALGPLVDAWMRAEPEIVENPAVRVSVAARAGYCDLSLRALRRLKPGDAIALDATPPERGILFVLAERLCALGVMESSGALTLTRPFGPPDKEIGEFLMSDESGNQEPAPAVSAADLERLPVRLTFELGRVEMTLEELRALGVGAPIPMDRSGAASVDIFANGRRIGAGDIVMIGDRIGVRVTRFSLDA